MGFSRPGVLLAAALGLAGCLRLGPSQLAEDQIGYSQALTDSQKRETLLNIVELRYGDTPTFLDATQVISGYQLQKSISGGFEVFPRTDPNDYISGGGAVQLQESPTFTFQPVVGEQFAQSYIRPLAPTDLLPLSLTGMPIDVLLRLAVRSINGLDNSTELTQGSDSGSPGFFQVAHDLRVLQIAGLLGVRQAPVRLAQRGDAKGKAAGGAAAAGPGSGPDRTELTIASSRDPALQSVVLDARHLLGMRRDQVEAVVTYGQAPDGPGEVAFLTRSMLGVLAAIAFGIDVPADDVARGRTVASPPLGAFERRAIAVRVSTGKPDDVYASVHFRNHWFWISDDDFHGKLAFNLLQLLLQLAKTSNAPGTLITIPAG